MSVFRRNYDYNITLSNLRRDFDKYPLELQLIWLFEIIKVMTFIYYKEINIDNILKINTDGNYVMQDRRIAVYLKESSVLIDGFNTLTKFRNKFVHEGPGEAYKEFGDILVTYKRSIHAIAEFAGVSISTDSVMYRDLMSKSVEC